MMASPSKQSPCLAKSIVGMRPTMHVRVDDDEVKKGQVLFVDKKNPGVKYTSPQTVKLSK